MSAYSPAPRIGRAAEGVDTSHLEREVVGSSPTGLQPVAQLVRALTYAMSAYSPGVSR